MKEIITSINKPEGITVSGVPANQPAFILTNAIVYAVICIATAALISFIFGIMIIPGITNIRSAVTPAGCFLFLGIFFTGFLYSRLTFLSKSNDTNSTIYVFLVFAGVFITLMLMGFLNGRGSVVTSLLYSFLFLLPFTIYQGWLFYNRLSFISFRKIWYLPEQATDMPKVTVFLNSIYIQIRMAPRYGAPEQVYEATVPGRLSVGMMFTDFIKNEDDNKQKEAFEDVSNQLFGWQFFVPSFLGLGKRLIDADKSLDENKIRNKMVLVAKRIPKQPAVLQITH